MPAVTDNNGNLACVTISNYVPPCTEVAPSAQFSGINEYAESYFSGDYDEFYFNQTLIRQLNRTYYYGDDGEHGSPDDGDSIVDNVAEIHFSTPFVFLPVEGATAKLGPEPILSVQTISGGVRVLPITPPIDLTPSTASVDTDDVDYGYVPQTLIDWMAANPNYKAQYPGLASCHPGGPSIKPDRVIAESGECRSSSAAAALASAVPDLTTSSQVTVTSAGCFRPGACQVAAPAASPKQAAPAVTAAPENQGPSPSPQQGPVPDAPATSPRLGGIIASALGGAPAGASPKAPSPSGENEQNPAPGVPANAPAGALPTTPSSFAISLGPSGSVIVVNGVTSTLPVAGSSPGLSPGQGADKPIPVGSQSITQNSASQFVEGGQTLTPGAPAISIQGTSVSLGPSASQVIVADSTIALTPGNAPALAPTPAIAAGGQAVSQNSASQFVAAGQTVTPGAPAISVQGTPVSLGPSGSAVVVAGSTVPLPGPANAPLFTLGAQPVTANSASQFVVGSQTVVPGAPAITISGTPVSLGTSGSQAIVGSSTIILSPTPLAPAPLVIGSQTFTANSDSAYVMGDHTLVPGQPGINVPGSVIGPITPTPNAPPTPITVGGQVFTPNPTGFSIAGTTISANGPGASISGTPINLGPSGSLVVGTSSTVLSSPATAPPLTVGGQAFTPNPTEFSIAGTTISAGGAGVTISGTPVSLGPSGSLAIGTSTTVIPTPGATSSGNSSTGAAPFTGSASRKRETGLRVGIWSLVMGACVVIFGM